MTLDRFARSKGWLILSPKEAYMKTYSRIGERTSSIYIFRGESSWEVWSFSHLQGRPEPISEKKMRMARSFSTALDHGDSFIEWLHRQKQKKSNPKRAAQ